MKTEQANHIHYQSLHRIKSQLKNVENLKIMSTEVKKFELWELGMQHFSTICAAKILDHQEYVQTIERHFLEKCCNIHYPLLLSILLYPATLELNGVFNLQLHHHKIILFGAIRQRAQT